MAYKHQEKKLVWPVLVYRELSMHRTIHHAAARCSARAFRYRKESVEHSIFIFKGLRTEPTRANRALRRNY